MLWQMRGNGVRTPGETPRSTSPWWPSCSGVDAAGHVQHMWWDEKIAGTIHLALGQGFPHVGGLNESAIHWDIVKDLRTDGCIYADGRLVQRDGAWLI